MVNGRTGPISRVLFLADKENETARVLVPTHPPRGAEKIAQGLAWKR